MPLSYQLHKEVWPAPFIVSMSSVVFLVVCMSPVPQEMNVVIGSDV